MEVVAVGALLALVGSTRIDADDVEKELDVLGPLFADDGETDPASLKSILAGHRDVAVSLEDASEVRHDLIAGRRPELRRNPDLRSASQQSPFLDELAQVLAVQADSAATEG